MLSSGPMRFRAISGGVQSYSQRRRGSAPALLERIPDGQDLQLKFIHLSMDMHKMLLRSLNFLTRWIRQGEAKALQGSAPRQSSHGSQSRRRRDDLRRPEDP